MQEKLATNLAKANLDCLAKFLDFNEGNVHDARQTADGMWRVMGEIYKAQYSVCIRNINDGLSILITDLSVIK